MWFMIVKWLNCSVQSFQMVFFQKLKPRPTCMPGVREFDSQVERAVCHKCVQINQNIALLTMFGCLVCTKHVFDNIYAAQIHIQLN